MWCVEVNSLLFHWQVYSVAEAVEMHRETHHPTQIGLPNALLDAVIELNMTADKKVLVGYKLQGPHKLLRVNWDAWTLIATLLIHSLNHRPSKFCSLASELSVQRSTVLYIFKLDYWSNLVHIFVCHALFQGSSTCFSYAPKYKTWANFLDCPRSRFIMYYLCSVFHKFISSYIATACIRDIYKQ